MLRQAQHEGWAEGIDEPLILSLSKDEERRPADQFRYCTPGNTHSISNSRFAAVSAVLPEAS